MGRKKKKAELGVKQQEMEDSGGRKIPVIVLLTEGEREYLDKKIDKSDVDKKSRSALLRNLVRQAMEHHLI